MKISSLIALLLLITNCDQKKSEPDKPNTIYRNGKAVAQIDRQYSDINPRISALGDRIVFLSARAPHEGTFRAYRWLAGSTKAEPLTSNTTFEETNATISPNGLFAAVSYVDQDSHARIRVQSFDNRAVAVDISDAYVSVSDIAFSHSTPAVLSYISLDEKGTRTLHVISFKAGSTTLEVEAAARIGDFSASEVRPIWAATPEFTGLLTFANAGIHGAFIKRSWTSAATLTAAQKIESNEFDRLAEGIFGIGAMGLGFANVTGASNDSVVPEGDKDQLGQVYFKNRAKVSSLAGDGAALLDSKHFAVKEIDLTQTGRLTAVLGYEVFACKAAGQNDYFGSSILLKNDAGSKKFVLKDAEGIVTVVSQNFCEHFTADRAFNNQVIDLQIDNLQLAATYTKNRVNLVYQSWHRGDFEIFLLALDFDGSTITNPVITNISSNTKPAP